MIIVKETNYAEPGMSLKEAIKFGYFSQNESKTLSKYFFELKPRIDKTSVSWLRQKLLKYDHLFKKTYLHFYSLTRKDTSTRYLRYYSKTENVKKKGIVSFVCYDFDRNDILKLEVKEKVEMLSWFDELKSEYSQFYDIDLEVDDLLDKTLRSLNIDKKHIG